jgi:hypothetical protein
MRKERKKREREDGRIGGTTAMQLTTTSFGLFASSVCFFICYIKTESIPLNLSR